MPPVTRPTLARLDLAGDPAAWARLGLEVSGDDVVVGTTVLRHLPGADGIVGWALRDVHLDSDLLDGVPTEVVDHEPPPAPDHPLGASVVDHVVLRTPNLARTLDSLAAAGLDLRRVREVPGDRPVRQAFYRLGEVILEVVGEEGSSGEGPSTLWGLVLTVADEATASAAAGDLLGEFRDAVQPGRRIATVRREAGLPTAVALLTPDPPRPER